MDDPSGQIGWAPPAPRELPDLRARLVDHVRSPAARTAAGDALRAGAGALSPRTGDVDRDAAILLGEEQARLEVAELFYVDADMTRLAAAATATLAVHGLHPEDVPAPAGFCVFAEPFLTYIPDPGIRRPVSLVAASWGDSAFTRMTRSSGVWMTFWSWQDPEAIARHAHEHDRVPLDRARRHAGAATGPLTWDNEVTISYRDAGTLATYNTRCATPLAVADIDDGARGADIVGGTMHTGMIVRSTWLLMTQPGITDTTTTEPTRAQRRRAHRDGREPAAVRVVRIRHPEDRPSTAPDAADAERRYTHRWTVRGHWRRQWYPTRNDHRPVWINPHVKGPDGAPLAHHQRVHLLDDPHPPAPAPAPARDQAEQPDHRQPDPGQS